MRILHVIPGIAPRYGGPSAAIGSMVAALNRTSGVTAEIATTDADGAGRRLDSLALRPDVVTHLFPRTCSERWKFSVGLWAWLRRHTKSYDLLHIHALWSFAPAAGAAAARSAGTPYIIRPAGMLSNYTRQRNAWQKRISWSLVESRVVRGAAAFHATSADEAKEIATVRPDARIFVIPQGIEEAAWQAPHEPEALRRRCGLDGTARPILLFLSRLHPKKGLVDLLLPALQQLSSDVFLAIAGGPDEHVPGYGQDVRQTIDRLQLNSRVALLGNVQPAERWALFDGATALVLPSHSENFGIVVAEAMARGCPALVSDAVHAGEHVRAASAGHVFARDPAAIAASLNAVLTDPSARARLGDAGRRYASANLTWDHVARQLLAMYRSCVNASGPILPQGVSIS